MELEVHSRKYNPRWLLFSLLSVIIHLIVIGILFITYPRSNLEIKVKEIKISLFPHQKEEVVVQPSPSSGVSKFTPQKRITREEVEDIVFEIVAPKIGQYHKKEEFNELPLTSPSREVTPIERDIGTGKKAYKKDDTGTTSVKTSKFGDDTPLESSKESFEPLPQYTLPKGSPTDPVSGNIRWIKGGPRKVIEWYPPEIPPNIIKKETEIVIIFYIEPSGFVSRIEVAKTSGEPLVDEIIVKTLRRIRFNSTTFSTVASVSLTIIPK